MPNKDALALIENFYDAFNRQNIRQILALVSENIAHDHNEGKMALGKPAFQHHLQTTFEHFKSAVHNPIILASESGRHASAKFHLSGVYVKTFPQYPEANGQGYVLTAGEFFELENKEIIRYTQYFNLHSLLGQLSYLSDPP